MLSAVAHGHGGVDDAVRLALVAAQASAEMGAGHFAVYYDFIISALSEAARKAFQMLPQALPYGRNPLRRSFSEGRAGAVIAFLEARGLAVSERATQAHPRLH